MGPGKANQRVIADRLDWAQRMVDAITDEELPKRDAGKGRSGNLVLHVGS
jgi:hypothetical protein